MNFYRAILIGNGTMGKRHKCRFEMCGVSFLKVFDILDGWDGDLEKSFINEFSEIDFVVIASPAITHYEYARFFLKRRIPIFLEKPIAINSNEAEELSKMAIANKVIFFVAQSECFNPIFLNFRKHFVSEINNALDSLRKNALESSLNVHLEFRREHKYSERCRDVNVALDMMIHDLCLFFTMFKINDVEIISYEITFDFAFLRLKVFKGEYAGVTADFYVNRDSFVDIRSITAEFGKHGIIPASDYNINLANYLENGELAHVPDSLENEHKFFLKLLVGACKKWGERNLQNAVNAIKIISKLK